MMCCKEILVLLIYTFRFAFNHNMQIQANILVKKDFLERYLRNSNQGSVHFDVEVPPGLAAAIVGYEITPTNFRSNVQHDRPSQLKPYLQNVLKLVDHLIRESGGRFQNSIAYYSKKYIIYRNNVPLNPYINDTFHQYQSKFQQYVNNLLKFNVNSKVDTDIIFLDIIQTSNRLIYFETIRCLQILIKDASRRSNGSPADHLAEEIFSDNLLKKQEDFKYLCRREKICRPYPGFSDYLADFIGELSKLPDNKMHTIIMKTIIVLKKKYSNINHILGESLLTKLSEEIQDVVYNDLSALKNALSAIRKDIYNRYKTQLVSNKSKGFRLLLDMIDKAFDEEGNAEVHLNYHIVTNALRGWVSGQAVDVELIELAFLEYATSTLNKRWTDVIREEARALVHIMLYGQPSQQKYEYLLINGSNYVNNVTSVE